MSLWKRLTKRGFVYLLVVLVLLVGGALSEDFLDNTTFGIRARHKVFQTLQQFSPREARAKRTSLVLIGDDVHWQKLGGRIPTQRDYLASILCVLDKADPQLIALDINLTSRGKGEWPYLNEDDTLVRAVETISQHRPVVLPIDFAIVEKGPHKGDYRAPLPSIFDGHRFSGEVRFGHIRSLVDIRQASVGHSRDGPAPPEDSFSEAIVRSVDPAALRGLANPFVTFMTADSFPEMDSGLLWARDSVELKERFRSKIVIVGTAWHSERLGVGDRIDSHMTPVGRLQGTEVLANYVEALLDSRTFRPFHPFVAFCLRLLLCMVVAVLFALATRSWTKVGVISGLCLVAIVLCYILFQNFGLYLDFYLPVALLIGHATVEQIREWHRDAKRGRSVSRGARSHTLS